MTRLHFGMNFGIECSIGWVWSIRANAGCHEHRRSKFALMNIQISKCNPYQEKFLLTERVIHKLAAYNYVYSNNENWHCKLRRCMQCRHNVEVL